MKLLAVDVGNTSTAVCLWRNGRTLAVAHCDGGFVEASSAALSIVEKFSPEALAYASVVPSADAGWRAFARRASLPVRTVTWERAERGGGVKFGVPDPASIGADRLADAAGAVSRYGAGVIVMDFGTALTAAAITRSVMEPRLVGRHMGMDPLVTLFALYLGFRLWGVLGMLLAPLTAATAIRLSAYSAES